MKRELSELVGILLGDGSLGVYSSKVDGKNKIQYRIKITLNSEKDRDYSRYIIRLMTVIFKQKPLIYKRKGENTLDIYLLGRKHLNYLLNQGLVLAPKWDRALIPNKFLCSPLDKLILRGYMDTDGCIAVVNNNGNRYPRIEMKICPSPMQQQLIDIMASNGFQPQVNNLERGKVRVVLAGKEKLRKWFDNIGFSNERNLKVARSFFSPYV